MPADGRKLTLMVHQDRRVEMANFSTVSEASADTSIDLRPAADIRVCIYQLGEHSSRGGRAPRPGELKYNRDAYFLFLSTFN